MPMAVKVVGYIHGFLFIGFVLLAWETKNNLNKTFSWFGLAFLASLLPFGTFVLDKQLRKDEELLRN
jgi:integral membrane protein